MTGLNDASMNVEQVDTGGIHVLHDMCVTRRGDRVYVTTSVFGVFVLYRRVRFFLAAATIAVARLDNTTSYMHMSTT